MKPIVIAHRGASGYLPEHTLAGYFVAAQQGADYIEPDLVMTRDGVLVARHENAIASVNDDGSPGETTTDVAERPEFAARKSTKTIDGRRICGWFTEDFTLAELKTLRCRERLPHLRPANTRFDRQFEIPTLAEILTLVDAINRMRPGKPPLGIYPETKHPSYFRQIGLPLEAVLIDALHAHGYRDKSAPVFLQSFEVGNLQQMHSLTDLPIIQLLEASGGPWDKAGDACPRRYVDMTTPSGLAEIARYANGIGVHKDLMIPRNADGKLGTPTTLVANAHAAGLAVHGWTFRAENNFLPTDLHDGPDPAARGKLSEQIRRYLALGMDGFFTDQTDIGVGARDVFCAGKPASIV